jgi:hypothetical protein
LGTVERIIREFGSTGVETSFEVSGRRYRAFAYASPGRFGSRVRWNLYESDETGSAEAGGVRGVTFGIAEGVQEAVEDMVRAAEAHARNGSREPVNRRSLTFRPSPEI